MSSKCPLANLKKDMSSKNLQTLRKTKSYMNLIYMNDKREYFRNISNFFFIQKVTPICGVLPSANFPQEKYFSSSNQFFPKKPNFPSLVQSDLVSKPTPRLKDRLQIQLRCT